MVESLAEMFRCFICMEKLSNAHLCPHCSKLCCHHCITRWLNENHSHCPHCRAELNVAELVVCRWVEEVTQQLDSLQTFSPKQNTQSDVDNCLIHSSEKLTVFCVTCQICICPPCALWAGMHAGHSFMPIDEVYEAKVRMIDEQVEVTMRRQVELIGVVQEVEKNMSNLRKSKEEQAAEEHHLFETIATRLESCLKKKVENLIDKKCQLTQETELLENLLIEVEHEKMTASKKEFITKSGTVLDMLHKVNEKASSSLTFTPIKADFVSELVPEYTTQNIFLTHFSRLQTRADPVYSNRLHEYGLVWRLKIYPDGNGVVRGNYLSVFLELSNGKTKTSKYEYRIEMVHPTVCDGSKNVIREFASDFEIGECWGYNRFFRLDLLLSEGYLDDNDSLHLKLYVRQPTYRHKYNDLIWYVGLLDASREKHKRTATALKKKIPQPEVPTLPVMREDDEEVDEEEEEEDEDYGQLASGSRLGGVGCANEASLMVSRDQKLRIEESDSETDTELEQLARLESSNEENDIDDETMFADNNIDMSDDGAEEEEDEEEDDEEDEEEDDYDDHVAVDEFGVPVVNEEYVRFSVNNIIPITTQCSTTSASANSGDCSMREFFQDIRNTFNSTQYLASRNSFFGKKPNNITKRERETMNESSQATTCAVVFAASSTLTAVSTSQDTATSSLGTISSATTQLITSTPVASATGTSQTSGTSATADSQASSSGTNLHQKSGLRRPSSRQPTIPTLPIESQVDQLFSSIQNEFHKNILKKPNTNDVNNSIETSVRAVNDAKDVFLAPSSACEDTLFPKATNYFMPLYSSLSANSLIPLTSTSSSSSSSSSQVTSSCHSHQLASLSLSSLTYSFITSFQSGSKPLTAHMMQVHPSSSSSSNPCPYFPSIPVPSITSTPPTSSTTTTPSTTPTPSTTTRVTTQPASSQDPKQSI